jgi:hypothetical protein
MALLHSDDIIHSPEVLFGTTDARVLTVISVAVVVNKSDPKVTFLLQTRGVNVKQPSNWYRKARHVPISACVYCEVKI